MTQSLTFTKSQSRGGIASLCAKAAILMALVFGGSLFTDRQASASTTLNAAAASANAGLAACGSNRGTALYNCVAGVLEKMNNEISSANVSETQRSIATAASQLRAATTKIQAVSAIRQCQSAIAGALRQVKAAGGGYVRGVGDSGLSAIAGVLSRAAALIQSKG